MQQSEKQLSDVQAAFLGSWGGDVQLVIKQQKREHACQDWLGNAEHVHFIGVKNDRSEEPYILHPQDIMHSECIQAHCIFACIYARSIYMLSLYIFHCAREMLTVSCLHLGNL